MQTDRDRSPVAAAPAGQQGWTVTSERPSPFGAGSMEAGRLQIAAAGRCPHALEPGTARGPSASSRFRISPSCQFVKFGLSSICVYPCPSAVDSFAPGFNRFMAQKRGRNRVEQVDEPGNSYPTPVSDERQQISLWKMGLGVREV